MLLLALWPFPTRCNFFPVTGPGRIGRARLRCRCSHRRPRAPNLLFVTLRARMRAFRRFVLFTEKHRLCWSPFFFPDQGFRWLTRRPPPVCVKKRARCPPLGSLSAARTVYWRRLRAVPPTLWWMGCPGRWSEWSGPSVMVARVRVLQFGCAFRRLRNLHVHVHGGVSN